MLKYFQIFPVKKPFKLVTMSNNRAPARKVWLGNTKASAQLNIVLVLPGYLSAGINYFSKQTWFLLLMNFFCWWIYLEAKQWMLSVHFFFSEHPSLVERDTEKQKQGCTPMHTYVCMYVLISLHWINTIKFSIIFSISYLFPFSPTLIS